MNIAVRKLFRISLLLSVMPFVISTVLYWYPSVNYFSYADNPWLFHLEGMKWGRIIALVSAPASLVILILMYRKGTNSTAEKIMLGSQFVIAGIYFAYWFVLLRIALMI